jgi:hypothetical protein
LIPNSEINMAATPAPVLPQSPSQYIIHSDSGTDPLV